MTRAHSRGQGQLISTRISSNAGPVDLLVHCAVVQSVQGYAILDMTASKLYPVVITCVYAIQFLCTGEIPWLFCLKI